RNEITTGNFIFRTREFEQMEIEYFVRPQEAKEWHRRWTETCLEWYVRMGVRREHLRARSLPKEDLAHYSAGTNEVEYLFPWGWHEIMGVANRTDYDLQQHSKYSGKQLTYFDEETNEHITPYVIEPSAGVDRAVLVFLLDAYDEEEVRGEKRVVLRLSKELAPIKVAVLPLSRNEKLRPLAKQVWDKLRPHFMTQYDDSQSIGRRYRRQDEAGTPLAVTIDFDSLEDNAVTIRERDSMEQERVAISELVDALKEKLA
ncbi:MAG: glycine--tRNA ligase, partial [Chloroflexi bacterium]|nr:glycine--tRNA ligase [Chloroflexota bacterium]